MLGDRPGGGDGGREAHERECHARLGVLTLVQIDGDGVGPELVESAKEVLCALGVRVRYVPAQAGLVEFERSGQTCPPRTLELVREHGAAIKGPFRTPSGGDVRSANYYIRRELQLYACLRPLYLRPGQPPVLLVRENTEDLYGAQEFSPADDVYIALKIATVRGCERIARYAFKLADAEGRGRVTVVHKANNLKLTEGLFLDTALAVARDYPNVVVDDLLADTACGEVVLASERLDVLLANNSVGDILSSVGAAVSGSHALVGSLNEGDGIYVSEAGHGDAGQLAGSDSVNPIAFLDGLRLLLGRLGLQAEGARLERALDGWRREGPRSLDLGGATTTSQVTRYLAERVQVP